MRSVREGRERGRTCGGEHLEQIEVAGQHPLDPAGAIAPRRVASEAAEDAARELPNLSLEDALHLVHLYAERESPKFERAALRLLGRYLAESSPTLQSFAEITTALARRQPDE